MVMRSFLSDCREGAVFSRIEAELPPSRSFSSHFSIYVKWFDDRTGYDFVEQEDGLDAFVIHSGINAIGFNSLNGGDRIPFDTV